jgi:hypothetical protein
MEKFEDYDDKSWLAVYVLELWLCLLYASLGCLINAGVCRGLTEVPQNLKGYFELFQVIRQDFIIEPFL